MIVEILVTAILIFAVSLYLYFTWNNSYFLKLGVPHDKPLFFFGNFKDVVSEKTHVGVFIKEQYDKFRDAAYTGYFKFNIPAFIVRDPELIKDVLVKDFSSFANNNFVDIAEHDPLFAYNAFVQVDEAWKATRAYMSPCLTTNKIKMMFCHMQEKSENLVKYLDDLCAEKKNEEIDAKDLSARYTTDVIASSVFGAESNSFEDPNSMYRQITKKIFFHNFWSGISLVALMIFPFLKGIVKYRFTTPSMSDLMLKISRDTIAYRTENSIVRNDFFQQMIDLRKKVGEKIFSDEYIACQAFGFLVDGFDTSSTMLAYSLFEIGRNTEIQNRLRQEMSIIFVENNQKLPYDEVINAKYLDMILLEVLRLHPAGLALEKLCTKPYTFPPPTPNSKPVQVKPGIAIIIPLFGLHMDPKFYPEPEKFNPENFTNEAVASRPKCAYVPFGDGPRACYGSRLGLAQIKCALANIVLRFEIRTSAKCLQTGYTIDPQSLLKAPLGGLWVNFYKI